MLIALLKALLFVVVGVFLVGCIVPMVRYDWTLSIESASTETYYVRFQDPGESSTFFVARVDPGDSGPAFAWRGPGDLPPVELLDLGCNHVSDFAQIADGRYVAESKPAITGHVDAWVWIPNNEWLGVVLECGGSVYL